jgi:SNF2 family DNA or RNA helicase
MIELKQKDGEYFLKFYSTDNFAEILNEVKKLHLKRNPDSKQWSGSRIQMWNLLPRLNAIENVTASNEVLESLKPKTNIVFKRSILDKTLLKFQPIKGKMLNENYQLEDIQKCLNTNRKIVNWDTGLGKSYLGSVVLSHLFNNGNVDCVLILCPNHLKINWKKELQRFFYKDLSDDDFYVTSVFNREPFESGKKFIICSYKNLVMISDDYYKKIRKKSSKNYYKTYLPIDSWFKNRVVICDESHSIKNNSRQTKIALQIKDYFEYRYLLSATIIPNGIEDIYYQMEFLDKNILFSDYQSFIERIAYVGDKYSIYNIQKDYNGKKKYKEKELIKLKEELSKYIITRKKEECLDLPECKRLKTYCTLEGNNLSIYQQIVIYYLNIIKEEKGFIESKEVKNKMPYILQAVNNIGMLKGKIDPLKNPNLNNLIEKWKFEDHCKLEALTSLLEQYLEIDGNKVIIWSEHPRTLHDLESYYEKYKPLVICGDTEISKGSTKEIEREKILDKFKYQSEYSLLLGNPQILKTGINVVESNCCIYFDRGDNFETYYQSGDRIYRIGQEKETKKNHIIAEETVDESIDRLLEDKADMNSFFDKSETKTMKQWQDFFKGQI